MSSTPVTAPWSRWIVATNRGPLTYSRTDDGTLEAERGSGGLVSALQSVVPRLGRCEWICAPMSEGDHLVAENPALVPAPTDGRAGEHLAVRFLPLDPEVLERHYSVVANPIIWFVQHGLWDLSNAPNLGASERAAFEDGYRVVNRAFADAIVSSLRAGPPEAAGSAGCAVMLHDYHLYLVAAMVREVVPEATMTHFVHIPWPQPDLWRVLPRWIRDPLIGGLVGNDLVAFQTPRDARNFLLCCEDLLGLSADHARQVVRAADGRTVAVRAYPISVDVEELEQLAASEQTARSLLALENARREFMIARVDRTDLSKNILRGFLAYDRMLEDHPELSGRVTFVALLQPSRQDVAEYAEYTERIQRLVADINLKHGHVDWQPIDLRIENNLPQALAAYRLFDVLLVNPVADGLNLVAKEGMLLNERNGVLVLSEHAGAHDEIGEYALSVHPADIEQQAAALYEALMMGRAERRRRRDGCVGILRRNDLDRWFSDQIADLAEVRPPTSTGELPGRRHAPVRPLPLGRRVHSAS